MVARLAQLLENTIRLLRIIMGVIAEDNEYLKYHLTIKNYCLLCVIIQNNIR
jgi:hypothetical protein